MVKLAPALPKEYDDNGLESNTRHLLGVYPSQEYLPIVALVRTKEITQNEHFERVPKIELVHVEIAIDEEDQAALRGLIQRLHDARVSHIKQPLDLPDTEEPAAAPLELEASTGQYSVRIVDAPRGKFSLHLIAPSGAMVTERHALPRKEYGEIEPGDHFISVLSGDVAQLVLALIQDFEAGFFSSTEDNVVDADVVDETPENDPTTAEEA